MGLLLDESNIRIYDINGGKIYSSYYWWNEVIYTNDIFLACGFNSSKSSILISSNDGINWNVLLKKDECILNVCYGDGKYIVNWEKGIVLLSNDLVTWEEKNVNICNYDYPWNGLNSFCYGDGKFILTDDYNTFISDDGINWNRYGAYGFRGHIKFINNKFIWGDLNGLYSSDDGITWNKMLYGDSYLPGEYGNGKYITSKYDKSSHILVGDNGLDVSNLKEVKQTSIYIQDIIYADNDNIFIAIGYGSDGYLLLTSSDGVNWSDKNNVNCSDTNFEKIAYGNGVFVVCGNHTLTNGRFVPNIPPTTPPFINHNATTPKTVDDKVIVTWGASTDVNGDSITYDLYFYNGKNWVGVKSGLNDLVYAHTIPITSYNTKDAKYKVRAFDGQLYSDFIESSPFELYGVIDSGIATFDKDYDLGKLEKAPTITYSIDSKMANGKFNVSIYLDDYCIEFDSDLDTDTDYTTNLDSIWNGLDVGKHKLIITAKNDSFIVKRTYTFEKILPSSNVPTISGNNSNLGYKKALFFQNFSTTNAVKIEEKIDNDTITTISDVVDGQSYNIDLSSIWNSLSFGVHKITITAYNSSYVSTTRIYNFYKDNPDNIATSIDGDDSYLGIKTKPFNCQFVVNDDDYDDKISVMVYLDRKNIDQTYNAIRGFTYNININSDLFNCLEDNSDHTIEIVASDGRAINTKRYIFTKKSSEEYIPLDVAFDSIIPKFMCKQNDNIEFKFKIQNLGEDLDLMDYTLKLVASKPDGSIYVSNDTTRNDIGELFIYCDKELTSMHGVIKFNIVVSSGDKKVLTQQLELLVIKNFE